MTNFHSYLILYFLDGKYKRQVCDAERRNEGVDNGMRRNGNMSNAAARYGFGVCKTGIVRKCCDTEAPVREVTATQKIHL